jgi:hypothetical protein
MSVASTNFSQKSAASASNAATTIDNSTLAQKETVIAKFRESLCQGFMSVTELGCKALFKDKEVAQVIEEVVKSDPNAELKYIALEMSCEKAIVLPIILHRHPAISYIDASLLTDPDIISAISKKLTYQEFCWELDAPVTLALEKTEEQKASARKLYLEITTGKGK